MNDAERREALEITAAFLAENPGRYDFYQPCVPRQERDQGCALAWLGFFSGMTPGTSYRRVAQRFGIREAFSEEIEELFPGNRAAAFDPHKAQIWMRWKAGWKFCTLCCKQHDGEHESCEECIQGGKLL